MSPFLFFYSLLNPLQSGCLVHNSTEMHLSMLQITSSLPSQMVNSSSFSYLTHQQYLTQFITSPILKCVLLISGQHSFMVLLLPSWLLLLNLLDSSPLFLPLQTLGCPRAQFSEPSHLGVSVCCQGHFRMSI